MVGVVGSSPIVPTKQTKKGSRKRPFFCVHEMPKLCGAGFIPADGGGRAAGVREPHSAGRRKAGPTRSLRAAGFVWGRVYPGQRRWTRRQVRDLNSAGRRKAGPTGSLRAAGFVWGRVYPGRRRWARRQVRDLNSASRRKAGPTGLSCAAGFVWGRVYPGRRRWARRQVRDLNSASRRKAGPTGLSCAAGFVWGRVYPGRRRWARRQVREPHSAGRRKAGPTGFSCAGQLYAGPTGCSVLGLAPFQRRHAIGADHRRRRGRLALGGGPGGLLAGGLLCALAILVGLFLLDPGRLARGLEVLRALVATPQFLDHPTLEALLQVALDAGHQVPVEVADQRDGQALGAGAAGAADAV